MRKRYREMEQTGIGQDCWEQGCGCSIGRGEGDKEGITAEG
jgi:hypothetical protein